MMAGIVSEEYKSSSIILSARIGKQKFLETTTNRAKDKLLRIVTCKESINNGQ
jgi:hypothetical protein